MRDVSASIESLVTSFVPQTQSNTRLKEELIAHCKDILASNIGTAHENDTGHLAAQIKRHLLQSESPSNASLKFTNLLSRLLDQPILSRKHESLLFLYSLASSSRQPTSSPFLASLQAPLRPSTIRTTSPTHLPRSPQPKGNSKAEILREYRARTGRRHLPEHLLLRDTLYLLQGISGKYVHLSLSDNGAQPKLVFVEDSKYIIPPSTKSLVHRLSEVGHLYARIAAFVNTQDRPSVGMIEQSLCHHLQTLLTEYYRLIAVLESQMGNTSNSAPGAQSDAVGEETGLTLKRLDVWITEWRLRMRMMSVCVEGAHDAQGGALVNLIHSYTDNGDPFVRKFTDQLLEEVSTPFFNTLHKWLFSGELYDPHSEFFVSVDPSLAHLQGLHPSSLAGGIDAFGEDSVSADRGDGGGGLRVWEAKYRFRKEMLPMFVGENFGRKIFSTGKSLNFIRYSCHDSDWVATREKMSNTGGILKYSDIAGLERSIDSAYNTASARLFEVFTEKFRLLDHLSALKHYLLLGYGDFAEQLMESLGPSLARPANTLYRHNLTATLETAIRTSSAQNDPPDVLRRLDARMLEYTHGELGWDVFALEYKVDAPLDTLLDPGSLEKYKRVFAHLWAMKRVEGALSSGWMRVAGAGRVRGRLEELEYDWHQIRITTSEMIHFIRQMQAYTQLEVIECSWKALMEFFARREGDLDAMIDAHQSYLDCMVKKVLLISSKAGREESLLTQIREVFSTILQFREAIDNFYNYALAESARLDQARDAARGVYTAPTSLAHTQSLSQIRKLLREYSTAFSERMQTIVQALQSHPDLDCRFLGIRLSFSEFYRLKKDREVLATQRL
ncbi:gamma-tubulin complex, component 3 [Suillus discolor]|uniref:Gamma-tubulin complex, component 3 n=1 Tax=Suillus discolor TaxID=1912936 RepID=A0A9P7JZX4_9AGAM|nr:gamma-tubulin complex, component 3 [Suillus discolor]KAG2118763.1 gamma-tubulin complex, component 3 [Suillus discolor]